MRIGFGAPVSGAWATPGGLARFAAQAEAAGYGSLWTFQRLLVPEGSAMEPVYHSVLDPMVALGYAAAVTSRIRLGVAVVNMPYLSPAYLAKQAASVDVLSGGRLDLGLGLGWMPEEFTAAEAAGYGSLWTFQRLLVPEGSAMEPVYHSVLDPMVALGYAAAVTSRIRLGVAVVNMPYLSPAYLAKQAASVDVLSGGRLDLGLGLGWMPEEFAAADAVMAGRGARTGEYIEVMRRLWAGGVTEFRGGHYTVPPGRAAPLPVQRPGPPVLLGGTVPKALQRVGRLADGWVTSSRTDLSRIREGIDVVRAAAAGAGRDPGALRVICRGVVRWGAPVTVPEGGGRVPLSGSFDDIRADIAWLAEQGVTEVFYDLNWDPQVGTPEIAPQAAADRAGQILAELAPR
ncbi:MAG TPA: TIGR03619 family F420-dependent LLM class oxidoreductase [Candidatus Eisenbacteria bacterium]|nr:TIGR03619 family F420-dependent LLM class oxidoreductase [Candidatus Eisenbacteria bacterium]